MAWQGGYPPASLAHLPARRFARRPLAERPRADYTRLWGWLTMPRRGIRLKTAARGTLETSIRHATGQPRSCQESLVAARRIYKPNCFRTSTCRCLPVPASANAVYVHPLASAHAWSHVSTPASASTSTSTSTSECLPAWLTACPPSRLPVWTLSWQASGTSVHAARASCRSGPCAHPRRRSSEGEDVTRGMPGA